MAAGREAFARRDWQGAFDGFSAATTLEADDLDAWAESAHWLGRAGEAIDAYNAAYKAHLDGGAPRRAALSAFMLAIYLRVTGDGAQADGWLSRAQRLLADETEGAEHGYPLYLHIAGLMGRDLDAAIEEAHRMQRIGREHGDENLVALGVFFEGRSLVKQARVREGLALLDEAMLTALSDNLKPMWTGAIYCGLISACHELVDLRRATEWTNATRRWCEPLPLASLYPGICRVHWAELLDVRGDWQQAEDEALETCREMVDIDVFAVADGWYEVGEIRRRRGDLERADEAYRQAHEFGRDPQPGQALLRLAQGKADAAAASVAAALAGRSGTDLERAPLLAAQVTIALASGDIGLAATAAEEIAAIATRFESVGLRGVAGWCRGAVALAREEPVTALAALREACTIWCELDVPYETARTRVLLARAYEGLGDADSAEREREAARTCFDRLGARLDLAELEAGAVTTGGHGLSARELEVLRLVAAGKTNRDIASALFISEKTVARHLSNIFTKTGVNSRSAATAFAFENGLVSKGS